MGYNSTVPRPEIVSQRSRALPAILCAAVAGGSLAGCGGATPSGSSGDGKRQELLLVSYAVTKGAYDRILPRFEAAWKARTGNTIKIRTSYGGSGSQTRAVIDGLEADVVTLALAADVQKLEAAGLIDAGWEKEQPHGSIITNSTVALITRDGNPKAIRNWPDLVKPGTAVITANPKTSGGARWNFLALWGSVTQAGGSEQRAEAYVTGVYRNVDNLPKDAREASDVFLKKGQGDVLLNYENEAILARKVGDLKAPFIVPAANIRIEGPVAVVDKTVDRRGTRKAAEALAAYLFTPEAQEIFADEGFRPTDPGVWQTVSNRFAPVKTFFTVADFGGWKAVNQRFFGDGGLWDRLFAGSR